MTALHRPSVSLAAVAGALILGLGISAWKFQLGSHASSPQVVTLTLGGSALVAGGKAKVWFGALDDRAYVEFSQQGQSRPLWLGINGPEEEVCGLNVKLLHVETSQPPRIKLQLRWNEG